MRRLLLSLLLLAAACPAAAQSLRADMVRLDRAYIPALAVTNRSDAAAAQRALDALNARWAEFKAKYPSAPRGDRLWSADLAEIDESIASASAIVAAGKDLGRAHEELEYVREKFLQIRERFRMPYYLDALTRYHDKMEAIYLAARGKDGTTLTDAALDTIATGLPQASVQWAAARKMPVEPEYGLSAAETARHTELVAQVDGSLAALQAALKSRDRGAIAAAAQGLRAPFSQLFVVLGDFGPVAAR